MKTRISDKTEASRILEEVKKIDPKDLGRLKAIGLRCDWKRGNVSPVVEGKLMPFTGIS